MAVDTSWRSFFRSRSGVNFLKLLAVAAVLSAAIGCGFYRFSVANFTTSKAEEKITALQLVDAFVTAYAQTRDALGSGTNAPVPATFRAHSIELFNKSRVGSDVLRLVWVGRPGREIKTLPTDAQMAAAIEAEAGQAHPQPRSEFLSLGGETMFRTVFPSIASQQSCVDCHNALRPDQPAWHLGDMMGAFSVDVPAEGFLLRTRIYTGAVGLFIFLTMGGLGLLISLLHHRQLLEREAAQTRIAASEQRFRDFAEIASDWFWEQDASLRYTYFSGPASRANEPLAAMIGKTRSEIARDGVDEAQLRLHEEDLAAHRPFQNFRFVRQTGKGRNLHISVSGRPIFGVDGTFQGYRGTAKDISAEVRNELELARRVEERTAELRIAQEELVRNERLSVLGRLTATVAHEIRNPLSAIRNSIFSLKDIMATKGLYAERAMARMERGIQRCDKIVADLLDYARSRELAKAPTEIDRWLASLLDDQKLPPTIALKRRFGAPGTVLAVDPERLRRVVVNLIDNAVQALLENPEAGARELEVATVLDGSRLEITIGDTGPGIAPEILPRIFEPLFSTKSFGTGLGLPTVKQIVDQHGGEISVESTPGIGTRVRVRLRCAQAEVIAA